LIRQIKNVAMKIESMHTGTKITAREGIYSDRHRRWRKK